MKSRWCKAEPCHAVLSQLLENIRVHEKATSGRTRVSPPESMHEYRPRKRRREELREDGLTSIPAGGTITSSATPSRQRTQVTFDVNKEGLPARDLTSKYSNSNSRSKQRHNTFPSDSCISHRGVVAGPGPSRDMRDNYQQADWQNGHSCDADESLVLPDYEPFSEDTWFMGMNASEFEDFGMSLDGMEWDSMLRLVTDPESSATQFY